MRLRRGRAPPRVGGERGELRVRGVEPLREQQVVRGRGELPRRERRLAALDELADAAGAREQRVLPREPRPPLLGAALVLELARLQPRELLGRRALPRVRGAPRLVGEDVARLGDPAEDPLEPRPVAAEPLPGVAVRVEDLHLIEVRRLRRGAGRVPRDPEHLPVRPLGEASVREQDLLPPLDVELDVLGQVRGTEDETLVAIAHVLRPPAPFP